MKASSMMLAACLVLGLWLTTAGAHDIPCRLSERVEPHLEFWGMTDIWGGVNEATGESVLLFQSGDDLGWEVLLVLPGEPLIFCRIAEGTKGRLTGKVPPEPKGNVNFWASPKEGEEPYHNPWVDRDE